MPAVSLHPAEPGSLQGRRRLILRCFLSPGDVVMLTAAVRDLHLTNPGMFLTDVRTTCPALWENSPYVTPLREDDPGVEVVDCQYPLIHASNDVPLHFIHGYRMHLERVLGVPIAPTKFGGDIHISRQEAAWMSQVEEQVGVGARFWLLVSGGKFDYTAKWWHPDRYQRVVDALRDEVRFVHIGAAEHYHPELRGVLDLRGKTDLRQLVRLVYHADGVFCGVTLLMHLAAAIPSPPGRPRRRACVVIAGGREPSHWEAYPHHQFLHSCGALPCCENGGCWKSRVRPLGDGSRLDRPENLCVDVVSGFPRCMDLITAEEVVAKIRLYLHDSRRLSANASQ